MSKLGRRQTIKLGAAAAIVGPSVVFSRRADAARPRPGLDHIGNFNFKVEIEGVTGWLPAVQAVDLGRMTYKVDQRAPSFDNVKVELSKRVPEVDKLFESGGVKRADAAGHKVSVALYGRGGRTPAVTYHVLGAQPYKTDHKFYEWTVKNVEVQTHKLSAAMGRLTRPPRNAFKVEINGNGLVAKDARMFELNKTLVSSLKFDPRPKAAESWVKEGEIKYSQLEHKVRAVKARTSRAARPTEEASFDFTKIDHQGLKSRDLLDVTTFVTAGQTPASMIFVKTLTGGAAHKVRPALKSESANKSTPVLLQFTSTSKAAANKASPVLMLSCATGKKASPKAKSSRETVKLELRSIDFPKLRLGSKALVTETLHFETEPKRG